MALPIREGLRAQAAIYLTAAPELRKYTREELHCGTGGGIVMAAIRAIRKAS
jgi:hypothetical protein